MTIPSNRVSHFSRTFQPYLICTNCGTVKHEFACAQWTPLKIVKGTTPAIELLYRCLGCRRLRRYGLLSESQADYLKGLEIQGVPDANA